MITSVSPAFNNNTYTEHSQPAVRPISLDVNTILLKKHSSSSTASNLLKLSIKILFAPITLIVYLISKIFSKIAVTRGFGHKHQIKDVDLAKRAALLNLGGQPINFGFNKKCLLEGMYFQSNSPKNSKTILICSGSHQSYEKQTISMINAFLSMGHNVMTFNYEGFGESGGKASEKGVYRSAEAAYQYLKQEKGCTDDNIVAWGYSLGSGAVTDLALKHKINIVLDRGFASMSKVAYSAAHKGLKNLARFIFRFGAHFDNAKKLKKICGKILIAQGSNDRIMTPEHQGKALQKAISKNPQATFMSVGSGHLNTDDDVWFANGNDRNAVEHFLAL